MPIEFVCEGCQQRLRVPDDSAGKPAKCPNCGRILTVPTTAPSAFAGAIGDVASVPMSDVSAGSSAAPRNPYASPATAQEPLPQLGMGALSVQVIDTGLAFSTAWDLFKINAGILVGAYVIQIACSMGISIAGTAAQTVLAQVLGDPKSIAIVLVNVGTSILNQTVQLWLAIGFLRITLAIARNRPAEIGMLFSGAPYLLRYIGAAILFGIVLMVGFLLLIIPGIYIALTYWSYMYFLVDRNCGVMESFQLAGKHASGNRLNALVLGLIAIGLSLLGLMACGVGILISAPLVMMMFTIAYLMMSGQSYSQRFMPG